MDEIVREVRERMVEAVRLRLRADVPVGIYLSGGIDSSVVAGIVTKLVREEGVMLGNQDATKRISCFSIQFPEGSGFNEAGMFFLHKAFEPPQHNLSLFLSLSLSPSLPLNRSFMVWM